MTGDDRMRMGGLYCSSLLGVPKHFFFLKSILPRSKQKGQILVVYNTYSIILVLF